MDIEQNSKTVHRGPHSKRGLPLNGTLWNAISSKESGSNFLRRGTVSPWTICSNVFHQDRSPDGEKKPSALLTAIPVPD